MLLAGKSKERNTHSSAQTRLKLVVDDRLSERTRGGPTFSFDEQDGGVSVGGGLHLSNQRFFFFIFFFFRLDTHTQFKIVRWFGSAVGVISLNTVCSQVCVLICID